MQTNVSIGHMTHSFQNYPVGNKPRSGFNRSCECLTSFDGGYLVPIWWKQAQPGDTLDMSIAAFVRMATQITPFMSPVYMDLHLWSVPNRLTWVHWPNFICGEEITPGVVPSYLTPQLTTTSTSDIDFGSLYDYCRIRPRIAGLTFNSFLPRAMALTQNEWYRDENLEQRVPFTNADSGDSISDYYLYKRGKRKDYFTGCLPYLSKGNQIVDLPIGLSAPVVTGPINGTGWIPGYDAANTRNAFIAAIAPASPNTGDMFVSSTAPTAPNITAGLNTNLVADLSSATGVTLFQLYEAIAIQNCLTNDNLHGNRYIEYILGSFGVKSSDARLQRPEFLGGGHFVMDMQVIPQTSGTTSTSPQGTLAANGIISGTTKRIVKSFEEHCIVFAYVNVRVPYYYQYGLEREFSRHNRFDYYRPELANLAEQAVLNKEIFVQGSSVVDSNGDPYDEQVFGYQESWADMRYSNSYVTGLMRSDAPGSLDIWHLAEKRNTLPVLNAQWIKEDSTIYDRVLAVSKTESDPYVHQFIGNFAFDEKWYRVMPVYSIPGIQKIGGI